MLSGKQNFVLELKFCKNGESCETLEIDPTQKSITIGIGEVKTHVYYNEINILG